MSVFLLEVSNDYVEYDLLEGDEVLVDAAKQPAPNGKDLAVFSCEGEKFISRFTRYGNQIILIGERTSVIKSNNIEIIGMVISSENEKELSLQR